MATPKRVLARQSSDLNKLEIDLPTPRVLLLDDNEAVRRSIGQDLEDGGFLVERAETTSEAMTFLGRPQTAHQAVIVDINLLPHDIPGDQFIVDNRKSLATANVVAITGQGLLSQMENKRLGMLESLGVKIVLKGTPSFSSDLVEAVEGKVEEIKSDVVEYAEYLYAGERPIHNKATAQLLGDLQKFLIEWLRSREKPDEKGIYYGGHAYSSNDIAREIERDTEIGRIHTRALASLFKR